ncbi:hypothetical protein WICPIJ_009286 [Wickerhamomyces pijperi]|uniref:Uncharacterized protein n=1 Tax=Wickerhamomyces pijperi TaxID=599730 RepID=A0A9P8PPC8_WICPI|nr:hypothetical protein WICPIJ_009286 [Wickerhamomyces pijperi]
MCSSICTILIPTSFNPSFHIDGFLSLAFSPRMFQQLSGTRSLFRIASKAEINETDITFTEALASNTGQIRLEVDDFTQDIYRRRLQTQIQWETANANLHQGQP